MKANVLFIFLQVRIYTFWGNVFQSTFCVLLHWGLCIGHAHGCDNETSSSHVTLSDNDIQRVPWYQITRNDYMAESLSSSTDDTMCHIPLSSNMPFNLRSVCPWTYVSDINQNRIPARLNVAKCRCPSCADNNSCKPVYYTIPVLMKECLNDDVRWVQKMQLVSVSCYCAAPHIIQVRKRHGAGQNKRYLESDIFH